MFGIRKKVTIGFVSLAIILFSSGIISLLELNRLGHSTSTLLDQNKKNIEIAKQMLDAVQNQNTTLFQMALTGSRDYDSVYMSEVESFDRALEQASVTVSDLQTLDEIYSARSAYNKLIDENFDALGSTNQNWLVDVYKTSYQKLTSAIKNYMLESQDYLANQAQSLEGSAHRAITPGIMALGVGIVILLMFLFFINIYLISPVVAISKALKDFLAYKIPFQVKMEGKDEILKLKESIEELVIRSKNREK